MDPAEPKGGARGATRTAFGTEVSWPPLPDCQSAPRVGLSRRDVTLHGEFQSVCSHPHRGTQRPQQGGSGLVRAPGFEAARLGQQFVRGRGRNKRFHPLVSLASPRLGAALTFRRFSFKCWIFVVAVKVVNTPCGSLPCANIFALFLPSLFLFAPSPTLPLNVPFPSRLLQSPGLSPSNCPDHPRPHSVFFFLLPLSLTFVHSTVCPLVLGTCSVTGPSFHIYLFTVK